MISTDFAANENWDDAWLSLKLVFQPWKWKKGKESEEIKNKLLRILNLQPITYTLQPFLSGRSALYYLLKSLKLPQRSEVLVQAFTCEAVPLPIIELGLKPVYIDIEEETFSMDLNSLTRKLVNPQTKVIILQHTFGLTPKYRKEILKLAEQKNITVIEDLAHGFNFNLFSTNHQTLAGASKLNTNHYLLLSFGRSKMVSSVFGGAVISLNSETRQLVNSLNFPSDIFIFKCLLYKPLTMLIKSTYDLYLGKILHKISNQINLLIPEITSREKSGSYDQLFNFAYPNALAALLNHQLNKVEQVNRQRAMIRDTYERTFVGNIKNLTLNNKSLIRYPLTVKNRDEVLNKLAAKNIFLGKWYDQVVAPKELDLKRVGYVIGSCPIAEELCKKIVNLPTNISEGEAKIICKELAVKDR